MLAESVCAEPGKGEAGEGQCLIMHDTQFICREFRACEY